MLVLMINLYCIKKLQNESVASFLQKKNNKLIYYNYVPLVQTYIERRRFI